MKNSIKWFLKAIIGDLKYCRDLSLYSLTRENLNVKPLVKLNREGVSANYTRPVCFFCSYDKENIVRKNVYHYLNELILAGFDIVYISTSDSISDTDLEKLSECCIRIIHRENRGYDFYGWKTGLEKYPDYNAHAGLLLANDSVIGPFFSIKDIITRLENCDADIVGMTDCPDIYPHLQSYFLYCKKSVVASNEFVGFFNQVEVLGFKMAIIRRYEVGFSRLLSHRFKLSALYSLKNALDRIPYTEPFTERPRNRIDPSSQLWKPMITELKFPFLKKSILTRRGVSIAEVSAALSESGSTYDVGMLA